jgi:class 3 adenylate cyclase
VRTIHVDVGEWLRTLGLGQYEVTFRESEIDAEVLPELTDLDLEKLGVPLGHRKRLLKAIASLGATVKLPVPLAATSTPPAPLASVAEVVGERQHITVMFCDLVGSTNIAARLDAEEWRDLVGAYLDAASTAVTEMGGRVAKKLGDGLMALFGYPVAQENDAERAVRAALSIRRVKSQERRHKQAGIGRTHRYRDGSGCGRCGGRNFR